MKVPSASNRAVAMSSAAAPNSAVVTSCDARSSASARRTTSPGSRSCVRSANRQHPVDRAARALRDGGGNRSEEHTSELQSHSFISYAVFCLKKNKKSFALLGPSMGADIAFELSPRLRD